MAVQVAGPEEYSHLSLFRQDGFAPLAVVQAGAAAVPEAGVVALVLAGVAEAVDSGRPAIAAGWVEA